MLERPLVTQQQMFYNLLEETMRDFVSTPKKAKGKINLGANSCAFSFRNDGCGIPAVSIASAVLSVPYDEVPIEPMSSHYSLNQYVGYEVVTIESWQQGHCVLLKYGRDEKTFQRKLMQLTSYPAFDYTGLLVHIEWEPSINKDEVLTEEEVVKTFKRIYSGHSKEVHPIWKPEVWFNGERIYF